MKVSNKNRKKNVVNTFPVNDPRYSTTEGPVAPSSEKIFYACLVAAGLIVLLLAVV